MARKSGLGRGLDALISGVEGQIPAGVREIPTAQIQPNPRQPRSRLDPQQTAELAASISEHGVIQPLIVTRGEQVDQYVLIAGERRLLAARQAGLGSVPVIIREASDQQRLELALIENLQREDLSPLEAAEAFRQLVEDFDLSHEQIATRVGKSRAAVTNTLRLLNLPMELKAALAEGSISEGHARALLALPSSGTQISAMEVVLKRGLNVRQTEELVRKLMAPAPPSKRAPARSPDIVALEDRLRAALGTKVALNPRREGGTLVIHYYSDEELNAITERILGEAD